jgi:hypothetical protein
MRLRFPMSGSDQRRALAFIRQVARMTKDGDVIDGEEYESNDEDVNALYSLIEEARTLTGDAPSGLSEE